MRAARAPRLARAAHNASAPRRRLTRVSRLRPGVSTARGTSLAAFSRAALFISVPPPPRATRKHGMAHVASIISTARLIAASARAARLSARCWGTCERASLYGVCASA
jgi:hypothetical protein